MSYRIWQAYAADVEALYAYPHFRACTDATYPDFKRMNLGSLAGMYGRRVFKAARALVEDGLVAVVASDIHSRDHCQALYQDGMAALVKIAGKSGVEELLAGAPAKLLASAYDE